MIRTHQPRDTGQLSIGTDDLTVQPGPAQPPQPQPALPPSPGSRPADSTPGPTPRRSTGRPGRIGRLGIGIGAGGLLLIALAPFGYDQFAAAPSGIVFDPAVDAAPVPGQDGLLPGGPAHQVVFTFLNATAGPITATEAAADLSGAPEGCPAAAWQILIGPPLPVVDGGVQGTVTGSVALAADAPAGCQGLTVPLRASLNGRGPAGEPVWVQADGEVSIASLGTPTVTVSRTGDRVTVQAEPAASGPVAQLWSVQAVDPGGRVTALCRTPTPQPCDDVAPPAGRAYRVIAGLGPHWQRSSRTVPAAGS